MELLEGRLSANEIERARKEEEEGRDPTSFLLEKGLITQPQLLSILSEYYNLPALAVEKYHPDPEALSLLPHEVIRRFSVLPLFRLGDQLFTAVANPEDFMPYDYVRQLTGLTVEPVLAIHKGLDVAINQHLLSQEQYFHDMEAITDLDFEVVSPPDEEILLEDQEAPVIKLVNYIISQAIHLNASDIHLERFRNRVLLRYRVDGVLHEFPPPPLHLFRALISRIKILSDLDIAERRLPQDGRATVRLEHRDYNLRISIIPNAHGEGVVIRILHTTGMNLALDELGYEPAMLTQYQNLIRRPYGIILDTGPTGSGKSTTLYATLRHIYTPARKIITLEDPVEYQMDGITQTQIQSEIGYTFAQGLRSILRHDPDVVMLGEIRDLESADIAMRASLTGHLVFSTLHTNNAAAAITRLVDMGVQPYLVMASLLGVLAQRLVRILCQECKAKETVSAADLETMGLRDLPPGLDRVDIFHPKGCPACSNLGYKGRRAIYELLEITPAMRRLPANQITAENLQTIGRREGNYTTLRDSAFGKVLAGVTSVEEILSLTVDE